ncbi:hypothetical protein CEXT_578061 [Caerostris extrusa]|uniref:Uncharacterized protein n=1 Tax=Caerostris extrusa TaxID=172846 RepID=A0AAV4QNP2_CAEEX|nr:hypothetical protein CEXT_578061 [Caerostris extrusa]
MLIHREDKATSALLRVQPTGARPAIKGFVAPGWKGVEEISGCAVVHPGVATAVSGSRSRIRVHTHRQQVGLKASSLGLGSARNTGSSLVLEGVGGVVKGIGCWVNISSS